MAVVSGLLDGSNDHRFFLPVIFLDDIKLKNNTNNILNACLHYLTDEKLSQYFFHVSIGFYIQFSIPLGQNPPPDGFFLLGGSEYAPSLKKATGLRAKKRNFKPQSWWIGRNLGSFCGFLSYSHCLL
ncbi:hypothetical protein LEP1GSC195_2382 [Leptospira wolbachii serovar Codice str. CDC]|uniref:Uncharacterized protein n=1 Tax=Leptospira wolbachii serovar Codice str. CDC TaxID=1218599 RepID=R9A889_9LEPT|nr:hypothetical protein LEP1GSC195_2382 [Leptospira wolbachii serovar Codice str. CDC]